MPRITIETKKQIGHIYKIYEEVFEVPKTIFYMKQILHYDSYHQAYYSPTSNYTITAKDYIKQELISNIVNADEDEME